MSISDLLDIGSATLADTCQVSKCDKDAVETVTIKPFDPIDSEEQKLSLCDEHRNWAAERNAFAEEMHDKMREYRKELSEEYLEEVQRLAKPEDWTGKSELTGSETIVVGDSE